MSEKIERGKQQILFTYLPGKVFDFGKSSVIARINKVRGQSFQNLNKSLIIRKIAEHAGAWPEEFRPSVEDRVLSDEARFVIVDPSHVSSEIFPLVFWCSNKNCKRVFNYSNNRQVPNTKTCPSCRTGKLSQLRFIRVHQCGHMEPLTPWTCSKCNSNNISLDDRGSERLTNFRWKCMDCQHTWGVRGGRCNRCSWPNQNGNSQEMSVEVFRSNKTFYVHTATLLNVPQNEYDSFFQLPEWHVLAAAKYLGHEAFETTKLSNYASRVEGSKVSNNTGETMFKLLDQYNAGQLSIEEYSSKLNALRSETSSSIDDLKSYVTEKSGIEIEAWEEAKYDVIDSVIPYEFANTVETSNDTNPEKCKELGIDSLTLISDFPIILASFGFSRLESRPFNNNNDPLCYLNPFPADSEQGGRYPIFVDKVQADALLLRLNPLRVIKWLESNGVNTGIDNEGDLKLAEGYFVNLFQGVNIYEKIFQDRPIVRMVLGLVHTFSHLSIKHATLLCGLEKTSISEYIIPRTLSVAIYCNHRFGQTIGALTALYEQSTNDWLDQIESERRCVYDPVCHEAGGDCHSCTHLAETSCRLFNQNLGRGFLFGGHDPVLDRDIVGYFDSQLN